MQSKHVKQRHWGLSVSIGIASCKFSWIDYCNFYLYLFISSIVIFIYFSFDSYFDSSSEMFNYIYLCYYLLLCTYFLTNLILIFIWQRYLSFHLIVLVWKHWSIVHHGRQQIDLKKLSASSSSNNTKPTKNNRNQQKNQSLANWSEEIVSGWVKAHLRTIPKPYQTNKICKLGWGVGW